MAKKRKKSKIINGFADINIVKPTYEKKLEPKEVEVVADASLPSINRVPPIAPLVWTSNFSFLKSHDPVFFQLISTAEEFYRVDPLLQ